MQEIVIPKIITPGLMQDISGNFSGSTRIPSFRGNCLSSTNAFDRGVMPMLAITLDGCFICGIGVEIGHGGTG